ncbi:MAG: HNH endonuclease [Nitrospirae bacterium]|nr:HNH endonuclease [Nitrospirota bacterium]
MIKTESKINYSYATIKVTQSRIDKGLIAIPVSLIRWFPDHKTTIKVFLDESAVLHNKSYSPYTSSTRECRIGGMAEWYKENKLKDGDEIVVQLIDKKHFIYRLVPEQKFLLKTQELQSSLDKAESENEASENIITLANWADLEKKKVVLGEYHRLIKSTPIKERRYINKYSDRVKEDVPPNIRVLLGELYQGHCQVCDFWFLKKDNKPYFEIHHINPDQGHHPKNLVIVCGNCHNQFEFANVTNEFTVNSWLTTVSFNNKPYPVNQIFLKTRWEESFKQLYI